MVESSGCSDGLMYNAENIFYLSLYRECLPRPALSHGQQELGLKQQQINRKHLVFSGWVAICIYCPRDTQGRPGDIITTCNGSLEIRLEREKCSD